MANGIDISHSCLNCANACVLSIGRAQSGPDLPPFGTLDQYCFVIQCGLPAYPRLAKSKAIVNTATGFICCYWESADEAEDVAKLTPTEFASRMFKGDKTKGCVTEATFDQLPMHMKELYLKEAQEYLANKSLPLPNCITKLRGDGTCDGNCEACK